MFCGIMLEGGAPWPFLINFMANLEARIWKLERVSSKQALDTRLSLSLPHAQALSWLVLQITGDRSLNQARQECIWPDPPCRSQKGAGITRVNLISTVLTLILSTCCVNCTINSSPCCWCKNRHVFLQPVTGSWKDEQIPCLTPHHSFLHMNFAIGILPKKDTRYS